MIGGFCRFSATTGFASLFPCLLRMTAVNIMHAKSWFFLVVSFLTGLTSAFVVAYFTFDAKPREVYDPGPTVKILVTKKDIPRGAEVTAEAVAFEDTPIAELPEAALTNFHQVYRRRAAFPIPVGYPVCEDFLLSQADSESSKNTYVPPGAQLVSLEVEQLRTGDSLSELHVPITSYLAADQKIDIRAVPRDEPQGVFVHRRNQLLKEHGPKNEPAEDGELILQNVVIHRIAAEESETHENSRPIQKLTLLLDGEEAEKLIAAAKKGKLRVVPKLDLSETENGETVASVEKEAIDTVETATSEKTENDEVVMLRSPVLRLNETGDDETVTAAKEMISAPKGPKEAVVSFVTPTIIYSDRREKADTETMVWSEEPVSQEPPAPAMEFVEKELPKAAETVLTPIPFTPPTTSSFIGKGQDEESTSRPGSYSPFDTRTRLSNLQGREAAEETENEGKENRTPRPLPLRSQLRSQDIGSMMFR